MTRSYPQLEQTANDLFFEELTDLRQKLVKFADKISYEYDLDYSYKDDISTMDILKLLSFGIRKDADSEAENLVLYMKLLKKYMGIKLFITNNLWLYFTYDEFKALDSTLLSNDIKVLNIENIYSDEMKDRNVYIIDRDLCEIVDNRSN